MIVALLSFGIGLVIGALAVDMIIFYLEKGED